MSTIEQLIMERGAVESVNHEKQNKGPQNQLDLLKDIERYLGDSSDTSEVIGPLGREPSMVGKDEEKRTRGSLPDNLPVQGDVLEDRGTGYNFGKRWSYFNGNFVIQCFFFSPDRLKSALPMEVRHTW